MQFSTAFVVLASAASLVAGATLGERQNRPTLDPGRTPESYKCIVSFSQEGCCFSSTDACGRQGQRDCGAQDICPPGVTEGSNGTPGCGADCCSTFTGWGIGCPK